jgi:hypothetical protein
MRCFCFVSIRVDTTIYTYADIDRALVQEGRLVKFCIALILLSVVYTFVVPKYPKRSRSLPALGS